MASSLKGPDEGQKGKEEEEASPSTSEGGNNAVNYSSWMCFFGGKWVPCAPFTGPQVGGPNAPPPPFTTPKGDANKTKAPLQNPHPWSLCSSYLAILLAGTWALAGGTLPGRIQPVKADDPKASPKKKALFRCGKCHKSFTYTANLRKHHQKIHDNKSNPLECGNCGRVFANSCSLRMHRVRVHLPRKSIPCPQCPKTFSFKQNMDTHLKGVHLGEKPFQCGNCGAKFFQKGNLTAHVSSRHSGIRHRCQICGGSFSLVSSLKRHIKTLHSS